jgi:hypothetical protein
MYAASPLYRDPAIANSKQAEFCRTTRFAQAAAALIRALISPAKLYATYGVTDVCGKDNGRGEERRQQRPGISPGRIRTVEMRDARGGRSGVVGVRDAVSMRIKRVRPVIYIPHVCNAHTSNLHLYTY